MQAVDGALSVAGPELGPAGRLAISDPTADKASDPKGSAS
jgi:hypothetical protein